MYQNILVPVDLSEHGFSDRAVEIAVEHATQWGAKLHLLNVIHSIPNSMVASYLSESQTQEIIKDARKSLEKFATEHVSQNIEFECHIQEGKAYRQIIRQALKSNADLIVMASHKHSRFDRVMLGSITSKVVEQSPVAVMVIKPGS